MRTRHGRGTAGFLVRILIPSISARWGERAMISATLVIAFGSFIAIPLMQNPWLLGAALGLAPVFWTCAMLMGGGAVLNRTSETKNPS